MEEVQKEIVSRFIDFFGEEYVDINEDEDNERLSILIYFPKLTITNEYNDNIEIKDTYVKIHVYKDGDLGKNIYLKRAYYTYNQYQSHYIHSHCPRTSNPKYWGTFCLGTGPIKSTIDKIVRNVYNNKIDYDLYTLFATELKLILEVESINGGPYITLNSVKQYSPNVVMIDPKYTIKKKNDLLDSFIKYLCEKKSLDFNFNGYYYGFAYSNEDLLIILANEFIQFYNSLENKPCTVNDLYTCPAILIKCIKKEGKLYYYKNNNESTQDSLPKDIDLVFKGKLVPLVVEPSKNKVDYSIIALSAEAYSYVKTTILEKLNYAAAAISYTTTPTLTILNNRELS